MSERARHGHRGYIGSRPYNGDRIPQHVQNLVIRDYCQRNGFDYLLSATEYIMPGCYMMLEEVAREASRLEGIVLYSWFMLPKRRERRSDIFRRILDQGTSLHGAVENIGVYDMAEFDRHEDVWRTRDIVHQTTLRIP